MLFCGTKEDVPSPSDSPAIVFQGNQSGSLVRRPEMPPSEAAGGSWFYGVLGRAFGPLGSWFCSVGRQAFRPDVVFASLVRRLAVVFGSALRLTPEQHLPAAARRSAVCFAQLLAAAIFHCALVSTLTALPLEAQA